MEKKTLKPADLAIFVIFMDCWRLTSGRAAYYLHGILVVSVTAALVFWSGQLLLPL